MLKMDRLEILQKIVNQSKEVNEVGLLKVFITCPCGSKRLISRMIRCLYCTIYFCEPCAHDHFTDDTSVMSDVTKERWWPEYAKVFIGKEDP
jgi:hypothetical protein